MKKSELTLYEQSKRIRIETLNIIHHSPAGHPGGSLSIVELITALYFAEMNVRPENPTWIDRDRFVLSKGHGCAALYAALGLKKYFSPEEFRKFRRIDGLLQGHPSISIPGVDAPSGSLGMGLSQGLGMALGSRTLKKDYRVYVILGDGDMQEGATWEALMAAAHYKLSNLCVILDNNGLQMEGDVKDVMDFTSIAHKVKAFNWNVLEIDGHDLSQIHNAFVAARSHTQAPTFIIARTIKGKGVSFMENQAKWHGTIPISNEQLEQAITEINSY